MRSGSAKQLGYQRSVSPANRRVLPPPPPCRSRGEIMSHHMPILAIVRRDGASIASHAQVLSCAVWGGVPASGLVWSSMWMSAAPRRPKRWGMEEWVPPRVSFYAAR